MLPHCQPVPPEVQGSPFGWKPLMQLNPQQEEVARHVQGRILTLAGPGSGKTKTLTERTGRLMRGGVQPGHILCLTFTNKARDEMRHRIAAAHGPAAENVFISNFHGLCGTILRKMGSGLGYSAWMTVLDSDDQMDLILQIGRKKGVELTKPQARILSFICNDWRENLGDEAALEALTGSRISAAEKSIIRGYVHTLRARNQCDFSGMLSETVRLLRERDDVRQKLQNKFRFIQVDEYQDTNRAQNEIVELLTGPEDNLLAVGDGDQSIYEWRGASPDGIPRFIRNGEAKTGACKVVKLGTNYRSTPQIISVADTLIRHCATRIAVDFTTVNPPGEPVKVGSFRTPEEEADAVGGGIYNLLRDGIAPREVAVFYRTNDMSRLVEQSLAKRQVPYKVVGSGSFYDRAEVKDALAMLRFLCNPKDGISFARIANKPARGMGDALIGKIEAYAEKRNIDLLAAMDDSRHHIADDAGKPLSEAGLRAVREARGIFDIPLAGHSVHKIAVEVLGRTGYDEYLKDRYEESGDYEDRSRNVNELVNSIAQFCRSNPKATIADYLQSISLYTDADEERDDNAVRMMSLHSSKGLEFDVVYMIGVEQGILPHQKAIEDRGERGYDEERRLCYVGFTRARKVLRVTWCQARQDTFARAKTAKFRPTTPSKFLVEAGLMTLEDYQATMMSKGMKYHPKGKR